jgi:hypothetical protein
MGGVGHYRIVQVKGAALDPLGQKLATMAERGTEHERAVAATKLLTHTAQSIGDKQVAELWDRVRSEEGYEGGYSYSGNFASKHSYRIFARTKATTAELEKLHEVIASHGWDEYDPLGVLTTRLCQNCWGRRTRTVREKVTRDNGERVDAALEVTCSACSGTGTQLLTAAELAAQEASAAAARAAAALLPASVLQQAAEQYNDKWGDAVAIVGADAVLFAGVCSS